MSRLFFVLFLIPFIYGQGVEMFAHPLSSAVGFCFYTVYLALLAFASLSVNLRDAAHTFCDPHIASVCSHRKRTGRKSNASILFATCVTELDSLKYLTIQASIIGTPLMVFPPDCSIAPICSTAEPEVVKLTSPTAQDKAKMMQKRPKKKFKLELKGSRSAGQPELFKSGTGEISNSLAALKQHQEVLSNSQPYSLFGSGFSIDLRSNPEGFDIAAFKSQGFSIFTSRGQ